MQLYCKIGMIPAFSLNMYTPALIQHVYDFFLNIRIELIVQCIDLYGLTENLFEILSDFRHRKSNDGKAALFPDNIGIGNLCTFIIHLC